MLLTKKQTNDEQTNTTDKFFYQVGNLEAWKEKWNLLIESYKW